MFIGTITIKSVELRKKSGWYGVQLEGQVRLNRNIAKDVLTQKARHSDLYKGPNDINRPGIYMMVHKSTNQAYVGLAKNLGNRMLQHICEATSARKVVGKFDKVLRDKTHIDDWDLRIIPCAEKDLKKIEGALYACAKDSGTYDMLNVQTPDNSMEAELDDEMKEMIKSIVAMLNK